MIIYGKVIRNLQKPNQIDNQTVVIPIFKKISYLTVFT